MPEPPSRAESAALWAEPSAWRRPGKDLFRSWWVERSPTERFAEGLSAVLDAVVPAKGPAGAAIGLATRGQIFDRVQNLLFRKFMKEQASGAAGLGATPAKDYMKKLLETAEATLGMPRGAYKDIKNVKGLWRVPDDLRGQYGTAEQAIELNPWSFDPKVTIPHELGHQFALNPGKAPLYKTKTRLQQNIAFRKAENWARSPKGERDILDHVAKRTGRPSVGVDPWGVYYNQLSPLEKHARGFAFLWRQYKPKAYKELALLSDNLATQELNAFGQWLKLNKIPAKDLSDMKRYNFWKLYEGTPGRTTKGGTP